MSTLNPMTHPTRCEHGRLWASGCPECERDLLARHPPPESLRDVIPEAIKSCARCSGPLINGWRIAQYNLPVCDSCKIALCGEVIRHKPSATSNTLQDSAQPHLPFDLVREWRKRAETGSKFLDETLYPKSAYNRGLVNTLLRCADELEANPAWQEAMKAEP